MKSAAHSGVLEDARVDSLSLAVWWFRYRERGFISMPLVLSTLKPWVNMDFKQLDNEIISVWLYGMVVTARDLRELCIQFAIS